MRNDEMKKEGIIVYFSNFDIFTEIHKDYRNICNQTGCAASWSEFHIYSEYRNLCDLNDWTASQDGFLAYADSVRNARKKWVQ